MIVSRQCKKDHTPLKVDIKNVNLISEGWNLKQMLNNYFQPKNIEERKSHIIPWHEEFIKNTLGVVRMIPSSEDSIINTIEEYNYLEYKKEK